MTTSNLKNLIRDTCDFPKKGVLFRDISPLLADPKALKFVSENLISSEKIANIDYFVGIESRGFILAAAMAALHGKGFIPLRKAGKIPPPVVAETYDLEYGQATLEMAAGSGRVALIDDVLATGGTLKAAINICSKAGYQVIDVAVLINLKSLNQMTFENREITSLVQY